MINSSINAVAAATLAASPSSQNISCREIKSSSLTTTTANTSTNIDCSISIDTTNFVVDVPQQDSGSNQSGSDSGLGYANSFSSDNSSTTKTIIGRQVELLSKQEENNNNNGLNTVIKNNNNESIITSNGESCSVTRTPDGCNLASSCTKIPHHIDANDEFVTTDFINQQQQQSRLEPDRANSGQTIFKSKNNPIDESELLHLATPLTSDELVCPQQAVHPVPVPKSLLKKPSSHLTSKQKHNRNVTFNQTVIVFCEEIAAPSPDDEQFDPPLGYQDPVGTTFEPPNDYCDRKVCDSSQAIGIIPDASSGSVGRGLVNNVGYNPRGVSDAVTHLTNDQILELLEDDHFLDENFKLNCDDLSEDDFPINHLNSNHGYLCNDAISDYDSDSESSYCLDIEKNNKVTPASPTTSKPLASTSITSSTSHQDRKHRSPTRLESNSGKRQPSADKSMNNYDNNSNIEKSQPTTKPNPQNYLPARMIVTPIDSKRQSNRQNDHSKGVLDMFYKNPNHGVQSSSTSFRSDNQMEPMLVKQTNLEAHSLLRSVLVTNNLPDQYPVHSLLNKNSVQEPKVVSQNSLAQKTTDSAREKASISQNLNQTSTSNVPQMPLAAVEPINDGCHICREIESNRTKIAAEIKNPISRDNPSKTKIDTSHQNETNNSKQPSHNIVTNLPPVSNQSCISCRDSSTQQHNTSQNGMQTQQAGIAQQTKPPPYQFVYVIDSKGNRLRAVVRATPRNPLPSTAGLSTLNDKRQHMASDGVRFPNPVSVANQNVNLSTQQQPYAQSWNPNSIRSNNAQQYRVMGPLQAQNPMPQQTQLNPILSSNIRPPTYVSTVRGVAPVGKPRPHTVYYVRQPLDTQNICQSFETTGGGPTNKSFPDPHEIRRLDGLRGPTTAMNLSNKLDSSNQNRAVNNRQHEPGNISKQVSNSARDEMDDPTFGFSKRPSVKVVATNSNLSNSNTLNNRSRLDHYNSHSSAHPSNNLVAIQQRFPDQSGTIRPMVVMRSQTLDRRHLTQQSQQQQQQQQAMKENIPSTSSMSNINGAYINLPTNKVSTHSSQQPRISGGPLTDRTLDNSNSKETRSSENNRLESNKNVILNRQGITQLSSAAQVPQGSNGNELNASRNNRKGQEQSEVVYSLNI